MFGYTLSHEWSKWSQICFSLSSLSVSHSFTFSGGWFLLNIVQLTTCYWTLPLACVNPYVCMWLTEHVEVHSKVWKIRRFEQLFVELSVLSNNNKNSTFCFSLKEMMLSLSVCFLTWCRCTNNTLQKHVQRPKSDKSHSKHNIPMLITIIILWIDFSVFMFSIVNE